MRRFEAYRSKTKLFGLFLLNILMVAAAVFCTTLPEIGAKIGGWLGVAFFGIGLIAIPRAFFQTAKPQIVMDDMGIHTGSSIGIVEWADIRELRIDAIKSTKFISIFVHDKYKYLDRMPPLARKSAELHPQMGLSEITICFIGLSPGLAEACYYLKENGYDVT